MRRLSGVILVAMLLILTTLPTLAQEKYRGVYWGNEKTGCLLVNENNSPVVRIRSEPSTTAAEMPEKFDAVMAPVAKAVKDDGLWLFGSTYRFNPDHSVSWQYSDVWIRADVTHIINEPACYELPDMNAGLFVVRNIHSPMWLSDGEKGLTMFMSEDDVLCRKMHCSGFGGRNAEHFLICEPGDCVKELALCDILLHSLDDYTVIDQDYCQGVQDLATDIATAKPGDKFDVPLGSERVIPTDAECHSLIYAGPEDWLDSQKIVCYAKGIEFVTDGNSPNAPQLNYVTNSDDRVFDLIGVKLVGDMEITADCKSFHVVDVDDPFTEYVVACSNNDDTYTVDFHQGDEAGLIDIHLATFADDIRANMKQPLH